MDAVVIGKVVLRECPRCEGIWADKESLEQICLDGEAQGAVLGLAAPVARDASVSLETNLRYVPCPVCQELMNRINFAKCSNVVVDVCVRHGTWFDQDELRRIVEFLRGGGVEKARAKELAALQELKREAEAERRAGVRQSVDRRWGSNYPEWGDGLSAAAAMLGRLLR